MSDGLLRNSLLVMVSLPSPVKETPLCQTKVAKLFLEGNPLWSAR